MKYDTYDTSYCVVEMMVSSGMAADSVGHL